MFNKNIPKTSLSDDKICAALGVAKSELSADYGMGDETLLSTLGFLAANQRFPSGIRYAYLDVGDVTSVCCQNPSHLLMISETAGRPGDICNFLKEGWTPINKVSSFFSKFGEVFCAINDELQSSLIVYRVSGVGRDALIRHSLKFLHYIQCALPVILPWGFKEKPLTALEMELLTSLQEESETHYLKVLERGFWEFDVRGRVNRLLMENFETSLYENKAKKCEMEIYDIQDKIDRLREEFDRLLEQKDMAEVALLGLQLKSGDFQNEMADYLATNKHVYVLGERSKCQRNSDKEFQIAVVADLEYFDEEMAERILGNRYSYLYSCSYGDRALSEDDVTSLFREVFINRTIKMRMSAVFRLSHRTVSPIEGGVEEVLGRCPLIVRNTMPNVHLDKYGCMGNYERIIRQAAENIDCISMVEAAIASTKSLNLGDIPVMNIFTCSLYDNYDCTCFVVPGRDEVLDAAEAVKWIKEECHG